MCFGYWGWGCLFLAILRFELSLELVDVLGFFGLKGLGFELRCFTT
jgi:hypothetical protein